MSSSGLYWLRVSSAFNGAMQQILRPFQGKKIKKYVAVFYLPK
jgi:hypothetical protein